MDECLESVIIKRDWKRLDGWWTDGWKEGPEAFVTRRPWLSPIGVPKVRSDCSAQFQILLHSC